MQDKLNKLDGIAIILLLISESGMCYGTAAGEAINLLGGIIMEEVKQIRKIVNV